MDSIRKSFNLRRHSYVTVHRVIRNVKQELSSQGKATNKHLTFKVRSKGSNFVIKNTVKVKIKNNIPARNSYNRHTCTM